MGLNLNDKRPSWPRCRHRWQKAQTIVVAEYRGIEVGDLTVLRAKARESGVYLRVLKNTLVRRAVADTRSPVSPSMVGPLIYAFPKIPWLRPRCLNDFAKTNDKLVLKAGSYAGNVLDQNGVKALASIPSREELLAKLLGVMQAPVSGFAGASRAAKKREREEAAA